MSGNFKGFVISGLGGGGEDGAVDTSQVQSTVRAADKPMLLQSTFSPPGMERMCYLFTNVSDYF
jgi:hypothetical protein